ncbi:amidohydrolase family protein [uncultured Fretibacterium sp.]|uniref:amidohydrolase family protein n=1 Tax=uncultured Fretibacterium sp. TaxID=1678694 RepID=UPI002632B0E4|nr:amidohydrolase family protein [uncultured Fretibacterium sp.]
MSGITPLLGDVHVHVGHFNDGLYFSPSQVVGDMRALGVKRWVVSSTSTGNIPFPLVRKEIEDTLELSEGEALPFLWVRPEMLMRSRDLGRYFFCGFWGFKVHGYQGWNPDGRALRRVFAIAAERGLPVMLHTGGRPWCEAGVYRKICLEFGTVPTILAHGRPVEQTIEVMRDCPNVYTDTAFMPVKDIVCLQKNGLLSRTLFGSDFPVMKLFFKTPVRLYYRRRVQAVSKAIGQDAFHEIAWENINFFCK